MSPGRKLRDWKVVFEAFSYRNFRWYWFSLLASFSAMQMSEVARGWLIYDMTGSALALGLVSAAWGVPLLIFSLIGGVVADAVEKRNLLILTQSSIALTILVIPVLLTIKVIALWHLIAIGFVMGIIFSFNMPTRQAFLPDLVPREDLTNAIALNTSAMNLTRIAGPALAGVLIGVIQIQGIFYLITICYALAVLTLWMISPTGSMKPRPRVPKWKDLTVGIQYVWRSPVLMSLMGMAFIVLLFAMPYQMLMPVFAVAVLRVGASGLGMLMSATGVGALMGSLLVAILGQIKRKGLIMIICGLIYGLSLVAFANVTNFYLAMFFLTISGAAGSAYMAFNNALIMTNVSRDVMGRVMSIYLMTWGLMPLGTLPAGALASFWGAPLTVTLGGVLVVVATLGLSLRWPTLARLE